MLFNNILASGSEAAITVLQACEVLGSALLCGLIVALVYYISGKCTGGFFTAVALIPVAVAIVIMLVNGNLGIGIAIAGAFSLVKFRSYQGTAREIVSIFLAMAAGLASGTGYVIFAIVFSIFAAIVFFLLSKLPFDAHDKNERSLRIVIPEELNYTDAFADIFSKYTKGVRLEKVKTTAMGTLYELSYVIILKNTALEKEFIDELRTRNANLGITCSLPEMIKDSLQ